MAEIVHPGGVVDLVEVEARLKRAFVARYGLDPGLDVAADAVAWAWANQEQVAAADNPTGLLYRVGQSRARRYLRWKRHSSGSGYPPEQGSDRAAWVEPGLEAALTDLDIEHRAAVVLVHCFQWTYQEVADLLDVPGHTESTPARPQRTWLAVAAACVVIAVGGIVIGVALDRSEITTAGPVDSVAAELDATSIPDRAASAEPDSPAGIEPAPDPEGFAGVDSCVAWIETFPIESAFPAHFEPRTETEQTIVLPLPQSPAQVQLVLIGPGGTYRCRVSRDGATVDDMRLGLVDPNQPLGDSEILLVDVGAPSPSTGDEMTGPATLQTVGRVGADVETVWAALDDGTTLPAIITDDGWFSIDGHIAVDVLRFNETYHWRLSDGTVRSAPLAALREKTAEQQCAAIPGCVEQRVVELQAAAQSAGLDQQASALADGTITESEVRQATQHIVDCLNEAGIQATVNGGGTTYRIDIRPGDDPEQTRSSHQTCNAEHLELISELQLLKEAEAQLNDND